MKITKIASYLIFVSAMLLLTSMTTPISSSENLTESFNASELIDVTMEVQAWTWSDFGASSAGGAIGGAAAGAVSGAFACCPAGAATGAGVGALAGAVGGAAGYAGYQAWDYFFGPEEEQLMLSYAYLATALD